MPRRPLALEGIALRPAGDARDAQAAVAAAHRIVADARLPFTVRTIAPRARSVLLVPRRPMSVATAWEHVHALRARDDVRHAEPAFVMPATGPYVRRGAAAPVDLPGSEDCDWALAMCRVFDAWNVPPQPDGASRGRGIVVAHPDTGYTAHPELPAAALDLASAYDFVAGDADPRDPLVGANPGHGTATGSVIVSDVNEADAPHVIGVAPDARLVPLRVSTSVVHMSWVRLVAALYHAIDTDAHVVSMSLGGPLPSATLHDAVRDAVDQGLVLVAAAGNGWPFVVWPAHYPEAIAVAACNVERQRWAESASGPQVDLTAPGESVWRARTRSGARYDVARSSGTSYATAHVAGAAALWLAHHGREALVARYGRAALAAAFARVLERDGVSAGPSWPDDVLGAGILDAAALLDAPLPASAVAAPRPQRATGANVDLETLAQLFPRAAPAAVRAWLRATFGVRGRALDALLARVGDEVAFHLATEPGVYVALHASLAGRRGAVAPSSRAAFRHASPTLRRALASG